MVPNIKPDHIYVTLPVYFQPLGAKGKFPDIGKDSFCKIQMNEKCI